MLESMIESSTPTRAEVSDIANAVIDGSDAVMLSGETAVGIDPTGTARVMARIVTKTERALYGRPIEQRMALTRRGYNSGVIEAAAVSAAISAANQSGAKAILAFTESGRVARLLSSFRTGIPVIGLTAEERSFHRMALYWGVRPALVSSFRSSKGMLRNAHKILQEVSWLKPDDLLVVLTGAFAKSGATNTIRLIRASSLAP
jgi:pyruvate kinase